MKAELTQSRHLEARLSSLVVGHLERSTRGRRLSGFSTDLLGAEAEAIRQDRELPNILGCRTASKSMT